MMPMSVDFYILLYVSEDQSENVTVADYKQWSADKKKDKLANFIYERLYRRYIKPHEFHDEKYKREYKNGFSIMANCCLLIETLESFHKGWGNTCGKGALAFSCFFSRHAHFSAFKREDVSDQFYRDVRCGILHQGETAGGWKITRKPNTPLFCLTKKEINANKFSKALKQSLEDYKNSLTSSDWESEIWRNFEKKMGAILKNCTKIPFK